MVRTCERFFPRRWRSFHVKVSHGRRLASAFSDDRVELSLADGASWVQGAASQRFDVIVVDSTDFGAAEPLFMEEFHRHLRRLLKEPGVLVINLTSLAWQLELVKRSVKRQRKIFKFVRVFQIFQPTYTSGEA